MSETTQFLIRHGLPLLFALVFVEQMGLPIPAVPVLLAAGALSADGKFSLLLGLLLTVLACLVADAFWFYLGRYRGNKVLGFLCRISLEPDSCVRRTQNVFTRYGLRGIVVAKFLPGMSTVAPPLAGMSGTHVGRFLLADGLGSLLYGVAFLGLGYLFSNQIEQIGASIGNIGGGALGLLAALAAIYIAYKYWQRQRLLRELRMARITVSDLRRKQEAGEVVTVLDLRSSAALAEDPSIIPGAIRASMEEIKQGHYRLSREQEIVVYCSCPNEETAARVALLLQRNGFTRVRPLLGGIDAWREQNYPMEQTRTIVVSAVAPASPATEDALQAASLPLPNSDDRIRAKTGT